MATALTVYMTEAATSATLSTADQLLENPTTGTGNVNKNTNATVGTTGWIEIWSQGNGTTSSGAGSEPAPSGHGWFDDTTSTLSGQVFVAGTWTGKLELSLSAGSCTADVYVRAYQYSGGVYTLIAKMVASGQSLTTTRTLFACTVSASASGTFGASDHLYTDALVNITASSSGGNIKLQESSSATVGYLNGSTGGAFVTTPGYGPPSTHHIITDGYGGVFS
ncbi:MAG TPA: hypothetical protein VKR06_46200 [Ktedonosporobacter sp.]|nr:hypothetical protein [Ktedonosporobacter sp.]